MFRKIRGSHCVKRLRIRDRVMTSHDTCISRTSLLLTVISLQRLKMKVLITAPSDCEVRSAIKFLHAQSIAPIKIHHQLCQVYGLCQHTAHSQQISCRSSAGRCLIIIHPTARTSHTVISIFSYTSKNSCLGPRQCFQNDREAEMSVTQWFQSQAADCYDTGIQKLVPRYDKCLNSGGEYVEK